MQTFLEYANRHDKINSIFEQVINEAEKNEEFREILIQEGAWDSIKAAGKAGWNFLKGAGQDIAQQAKGAWSAATGPATQLTHALTALQNCQQTIAKTPEIANSMTTGDQAAGFKAMPLTSWLTSIIKQLQSQIPQIKNMTVTGSKAGYGGAAQPAQGVPVGTAPAMHGPAPTTG